MGYVIDSDVLMQASRLHYGFSICPGFWSWLDVASADGRLLSIDKVKEEVLHGFGELVDWAKARPSLFVPTDDSATYESLKLLSVWASTSYQPAAVARFFGAADFLLVGYAHAHGHTVVTQEKLTEGAQIKIPKACQQMDVECINVYELLARERVRFVLAPPSQ